MWELGEGEGGRERERERMISRANIIISHQNRSF
jgi:hypothetical protein